MRSKTLVLLLFASLPATAQWTLPDVVRRAGRSDPRVAASLEQLAAAAAGVQLARNAYLPRGEFLAQVNRATRNNVYGMLLPNTVIAPISGPTLMANAGTSVWGSATGVLVSWEPFDFGLRRARIATADAARVLAEKGYARTRFETESAAAAAFLTVLAADRVVDRARAGVERAAAFERITDSLANAELKPAADAARARAEHAAAEAQLIQAEQAAQTARVALVELVGGDPADVKPVPGRLAEMPRDVTSLAAAPHPALQEQQAALDEARARTREFDKAWVPKLAFQSALYARGTGVRPDYTAGGGASGLGPNIYNWGLGFSVTFPFLDLPNVRMQRLAENHKAAAESRQLQRVERELSAERQRAQASLEAALRLAQTTPVQLEAARTTEQQAQARYRAGLATALEVADAERLLTQAEIDDALARLAVWRGHLAVATAAGDLTGFLAQVEP
jgi:outer membrane protein